MIKSNVSDLVSAGSPTKALAGSCLSLQNWSESSRSRGRNPRCSERRRDSAKNRSEQDSRTRDASSSRTSA